MTLPITYTAVCIIFMVAGIVETYHTYDIVNEVCPVTHNGLSCIWNFPECATVSMWFVLLCSIILVGALYLPLPMYKTALAIWDNRMFGPGSLKWSLSYRHMNVTYIQLSTVFWKVKSGSARYLSSKLCSSGLLWGVIDWVVTGGFPWWRQATRN